MKSHTQKINHSRLFSYTEYQPPVTSGSGLEILEYEKKCIHLDCVKKLKMALVTYFEKKVNFDDPSKEKSQYISNMKEPLATKNQGHKN